ADLHLAGQRHVGRLAHRVGGGDRGDQALGLDQAERLAVAVAPVAVGSHRGSLLREGVRGQETLAAAWRLPMVGNTPPMSSCGRAALPTGAAAAAPASMAALTAATSPTTMAVTRPLPIFCQPIRVTLADLSMASLASISGTRPLVSIMPRASRLLFAMAPPEG